MTDPRKITRAAKTLRILTALMLAVCFLAGCDVFSTDVYDDIATAGAKARTQLAEHRQTVSISCNSSDYNQLLGADFVWRDVEKEAVTHTGDPALGDHIAIGVMGYTLNSTVYKRDDGTHDLALKIEPVYSTTKEQEAELSSAAERILRSLNISGASDHDKALAIYGYICDNVVYDHDHLGDENYLLQFTAYAAATKGTAVCAGIADLFYYLANSAGLDARITTNSDHAWNIVRVDGRYYYVDATWDLGSRPEDYRYFLKGRYDFQGHRGNVSYTMYGFSNLLVHTDLNYDISEYGYGTSNGRD